MKTTYFSAALLLVLGACGSNGPGASSRLQASDYDQTCTDITQCVLVDLEVCSSCNCPDAAIADVAHAAYVADKNSLRETVCPELGQENCPSCPLREPQCFEATCSIR